MRPRNAVLTTFRRAVLSSGLALGLAFTMPARVPAQATFEAGLDAFLRGDHASAAARWEPLARSGHAQSAFNLGRMGELGQGAPADDAAAAAWFRIAAERGHPGAQHALGQLIAEGRGGESDPVEAHLWLALAARQAVPGSAGARLIALQVEALRRRLSADQVTDAEAALANWSPRRD